jgi:hypothetical protein
MRFRVAAAGLAGRLPAGIALRRGLDGRPLAVGGDRYVAAAEQEQYCAIVTAN